MRPSQTDLDRDHYARMSDPDLERNLIAAYLGDPAAADMYPVSASDLGDPKTAAVLGAIHALRARPERPAVDEISIREMLKEQRVWGRHGLDDEYLMSLRDTIVLASSVPVIRARIREKASLRRSRESAANALRAFDQGDHSGGLRIMREAIEDPGLDTSEERVKSMREVCEVTALALMDGEAAGPTLGGSRFPTLNARIRLTGGALIVIGAQSNVGKSTLAFDLLLDLAQHTVPVGLISCEDPEEDFGAKALGNAANVDPAKMWERRMTREERLAFIDAPAKIKDLPFRFSAPKTQHIDAVLADMAHMVRVHGAVLICIDYLQAINGGRGHSPRERTDDVLARIIVQARLLGCDTLLLSQLRRPQKDPFREPHIIDLKESGTIENRAQSIILLWRTSDQPGAELYAKLAKRKRGQTGMRFRIYRDELSKGFTETPPANVAHFTQPHHADEFSEHGF